MLAGGGLKIAYRAGVLQVWLDEAGIEFDHADAVELGVRDARAWCRAEGLLQAASGSNGRVPG
jgi:hypothetical protein